MTASKQWSLSTAFVFFTLSAVISAMVSWYGLQTVIIFSLSMGMFLAVVIVVHFLVSILAGSLRRSFRRGEDDIRIEFAREPEQRRLPDVEFVIAAAEDGLVSEPNSSIRYLDPPVNDRDVASLADCPELKWLVLDNTDVSDAGLAFLHGLTKLRRLYVRGSRVSADGVAQLEAALPDVTVVY